MTDMDTARKRILEGIDGYGCPSAVRLFGPARPVATWSQGNSKIGHMLNLSLAPFLTCPDCASCAGKCYAYSPYRRYPGAAHKWNSNTLAFETDALDAARQLAPDARSAELARLLVSGDARTQAYVDGFVSLANAAPGCRMYIYTKTSDLHDWSAAPDNLQVLHSQWPGRPVTARTLEDLQPVRRAWIVGDDRAPSTARVCPATFPDRATKRAYKESGRAVITCAECGLCPFASVDILFHLH